LSLITVFGYLQGYKFWLKYFNNQVIFAWIIKMLKLKRNNFYNNLGVKVVARALEPAPPFLDI